MRVLVRALAVACAVLLAVPLAGTVPASAAANPALVHFDTDAGVCSSSASSGRANPGDSITLTWSDARGGINATWEFTGPSGRISVPMSTSRASSVSFSALGTYSLDPSFSFGCSLTMSIVSEPVEPPEAHDYFQQVGVPASGDCADVPTWVGHWRGFPIGGWGKSWAQWIYDGTGGPVCTRVVEERPDGTVVVLGQ